MIVETLIAGTTIIIVSSLVFANSVLKRQRQWDQEDEAPEEPELELAPIIEPFIAAENGISCPKCGVTTGYRSSRYHGLKDLKACFGITCKIDKPHLHAGCYSCDSEWIMAPADSKKNEELL
jgi:hypothetical protein